MDVGHVNGGADIEDRDDPMLASADGVIRLFNEDSWTTHYFCPGLSAAFYLRFLPAGDARLDDLLERGECNYVVHHTSGTTAIIAHGEQGKGPYITKYAHLSSVDLEPAVLARPVRVNGELVAYRIRRGERIGYIGGTGGWVPHVHFEIRRMPRTPSAVRLWYGTGAGAMKCAGAPPYNRYCGWHPERFMLSFLDPEELLPPQPPAWPRPDSDSVHTFSVTSVDSVIGKHGVSLAVRAQALSPRFYPAGSGSGDRRQLVGLEATRPGVTRYSLDATCRSGSSSTERPRATNAVDSLFDVPLSLAPSARCELELGSLNPTFRHVAAPTGFYGKLIAPADNVNRQSGSPVVIRSEYADPRGPAVTINLVGGLESGIGQYSSPQTVAGSSLDLFTFRAVPGKTSLFCTTVGAASTSCADESSDSNIAELLIVGPAEEGESGVVTTGLTEDATGLAWQVPVTTATVETYAVVVRRRARYDGGDVSDYTYRLKYTVHVVPVCDPNNPDDLLVLYCIPPAPTITGTTNITYSGFAVNFSASHRATGYQVELTVDGISTIEDVENIDGTATIHSHPFSGLKPNADYRVRVQALNAIGPSAWSGAREVTTLDLPDCSSLGRGASARGAELPQCRLGMPTGLNVEDVTDTAATLGWTLSGGATGVKLFLDGNEIVPDPPLAAGATSYRFKTLTARRAHELGVQATRGAIESAFAGLTLLVPPTLNTPTATANSITLTWTALVNLTYEVKLGAGSAESARNPSSHTFSPLPSDTPHTLYVRARNPQGPSAWASTNKRTTGTTVVIPPETKVCWDGSVIPVDQDCPPPPTCGVGDLPDCPTCGVGDLPDCPTCGVGDLPDCPTCGVGDLPDCPPPPTCGVGDLPDCPTCGVGDLPDCPTCGVGDLPDCPTCGVGDLPDCPTCGVGDLPDCPTCGVGDLPDCPTCGVGDLPDCPTCGVGDLPDCPTCGVGDLPDCPTCGVGDLPDCPTCGVGDLPDCPTCGVGDLPDCPTCGVGDLPDCPTKCETEPKPADFTTMPHPPISTVEYQWITFIDIVTFDCTLHQQQRTTTTTTRYHVTFSCDGMCWVSSVTSSSTSVSSGWASTGVTSSCNTRRSATGSTMTLTAGSYEMQWGDQRIVFTVPAGATVELSRLQQESGDYVAVLSTKKGAELVVGADALSGDDQARATRFAGTTDPTLSAIAASLRDPAAEAPEPSVTTTTECAVAEPSEDGVANVDLDAESCVIVRGGGAVTVVQDGESLAFTLAAGRDWLVVDGTGADEAGTTAATFVDLLTGGYLTLSFADATELARHIPEGNTDLPALFDAMIPAAPANDGS